MYSHEEENTYSQYDLCDLFDLHSNQLDWLLKGFLLPDLFLKDEQIVAILNQYQLTNPIELLKAYCYIKIGRSIRPLKKLYTNVFNNPLFKTESMVIAAIKVIKAAQNIDYAIDDIIALTYRFLFNAQFKTLIERASSYGKQIKVHWSDKRVREQLELMVKPDEVQYTGELHLPSSARLITTHEELAKESYDMNHCIIEYWDDIKSRECFVINVGLPSRITVLIRLCEFMDWYIITEANGEQNSEVYRYDLKELAEIIKKPESQKVKYINAKRNVFTRINISFCQ